MMLRRQFALKAEDSYIFVLSFASTWKNISIYYIAQEPVFYMSKLPYSREQKHVSISNTPCY